MSVFDISVRFLTNKLHMDPDPDLLAEYALIYYNYFSQKSKEIRKNKEYKDEISRDKILKAFYFKKVKKGAKQIKMTLRRQFKIIYNLKRIRRIMKKYNIICPIRKANPFRRKMKAHKEHTIVSNKLKRNFKQNTPGKVLLTDIIKELRISRKQANNDLYKVNNNIMFGTVAICVLLIIIIIFV